MHALLKQLTNEEILAFIGRAKVAPDEMMLHDIEEQKQRVIALSTPRYVLRAFPLEHQQLQGLNLTLSGNDSKRLLAECHHCILMAVTLGQKVDVEMKRLQLKDMGKAIIFDSCANAAIEHVCDALQEELRVEYQTQGQYLSDRYSCGYGDLPLMLQKDFLKVLDASKKAGIYMNESYILHPMKSVTAIIGVADCMQPAILRGCAYCSLRQTCTYQKGGVTCGKQ